MNDVLQSYLSACPQTELIMIIFPCLSNRKTKKDYRVLFLVTAKGVGLYGCKWNDHAGKVRNFADQAQQIGDPRVITGLLQRLSKELLGKWGEQKERNLHDLMPASGGNINRHIYIYVYLYISFIVDI